MARARPIYLDGAVSDQSSCFNSCADHASDKKMPSGRDHATWSATYLSSTILNHEGATATKRPKVTSKQRFPMRRESNKCALRRTAPE